MPHDQAIAIAADVIRLYYGATLRVDVTEREITLSKPAAPDLVLAANPRRVRFEIYTDTKLPQDMFIGDSVDSLNAGGGLWDFGEGPYIRDWRTHLSDVTHAIWCTTGSFDNFIMVREYLLVGENA